MKTIFSKTGIGTSLIILLIGAVFFFWRGPMVADPNVPKVKRGETQTPATVQALIDQGNSAFLKKNISSALNSYQKALSQDESSYLAYEKIGDVYFYEKNYSTSLQNYNAAASRNKENTVIPLKIVRTLLGLRKTTQAKAEVEKITPESQASLYYRGLLAALFNEKDKAKDFLQKSISKGTDEKLKNYAQKVITAYKEFELTRDAPIEYLQTLISKTFNSIEEYGLSIELGFDAIKTKPDYRDAWIILGHSFLHERKWFDAQDAFTKALSLDSGSASAYFYRGVGNRALQKPSDAIRDFESALQAGWQPRVLAQLQLADIYFSARDYERAFTLYKQVVTTDSSNVNYFIRPIALAINQINRPAEALALGRKALSSHPEDAMAFNLLGWAYLATNDLTKAQEHLQKAVEKNNQLDSAYLNLGRLGERQSDLQKALSNYKKAVELAQKAGNDSIVASAQSRIDQLEKNPESMLSSPQNFETSPSSPEGQTPSLNLL